MAEFGEQLTEEALRDHHDTFSNTPKLLSFGILKELGNYRRDAATAHDPSLAISWLLQDFDFLGRALEDLGVLGEDSRLMLASFSAFPTTLNLDSPSPANWQPRIQASLPRKAKKLPRKGYKKRDAPGMS